MIFCLSLLHHERPDVLKEVFSEYEEFIDGFVPAAVKGLRGARKHFPTSIYILIQ